jgi:quercetin dioxygenase-like cupin family protein
MEIETLNINKSIRDYSKSFNASKLVFDLPALIKNMKHSHTWKRGGLNAMILMKGPDRQIVLTVMHGGTEIKSFQANDSITFQIIEGKMKFQGRKESVILDKGQFLTLHENIKYCLTTKEETVFLLTIANSTLKPFGN